MKVTTLKLDIFFMTDMHVSASLGVHFCVTTFTSLEVCVCVCVVKAGLTVCCRAAIGQRAQINNHAVQTDVELPSRYNRAFVLRLQHQTQLDVLH